MKSASFEPYLDLPGRTRSRLLLALGSARAPRERLKEAGWEVCDPLESTRTLTTYQAFIRESKAEFSVAKQGYVSAGSGWFSERSAAYLASGRPVVVQDTGFTRWMTTGHGVLAFSRPEEALGGIESVAAAYVQHCRSARELACAYFDSGRVLTSLLDRLRGTAHPARVREL
jgi:hypothetical protein